MQNAKANKDTRIVISSSKNIEDLDSYKIISDKEIDQNSFVLLLKNDENHKNSILGGLDFKVEDFNPQINNEETEDNFLFMTAFPDVFEEKFSYLTVSILSKSYPIDCQNFYYDFAENIFSRALLNKCSKIFQFIDEDELEIYSNIYKHHGYQVRFSKVFGNINILLADLSKKEPNSIEDQLVCEVSTNQKDIEQYYGLRERAFKQRLNCSNYSGKEDEYDRNGVIILAKCGEEVVGGTRIVISAEEKRMSLPFEDANFNLKLALPELDLENYKYGEITKFAVKPELMKGNVSSEITRVALLEMVNRDCDYQFSVAPMLQARNSRLITKKLNLIHSIQKDIKVPYNERYEQYSMVFAITYLKPYLFKKHCELKNSRLIA